MATNFQGSYENSDFVQDVAENDTIPVTGELFTAAHVLQQADETVGLGYAMGLPGLRGTAGPVWGSNIALTGTAVSSLTTVVFSATQTGITVGALIAGASPTATGWRRVTDKGTGITMTVNAAFDVSLNSETAYRHGTAAERLTQMEADIVAAGGGISVVDTATIDLTLGGSGTLTADAVAGRSYAILSEIGTTTAGWGSTRLYNARFVNSAVTGSALSVTQSSTNGDLITCNTAGGYLIEALLVHDTTLGNIGVVITKNTTDPGTTDPNGNDLNGTIERVMIANAVTTGGAVKASGLHILAVNDVIRVHGRGANQTFHSLSYFRITRMF